jgi:16S rRNA processing protein RimM
MNSAASTGPETGRTDVGDDAVWPADAIEVGRILDAYGVKGWIKVQSHSNDPTALLAARRWFLKPSADQVKRRIGPTGAATAKSTAKSTANPVAKPIELPHSLQITSSRDHGDVIVAQAQGVVDRDAAEALRGAAVFVPRSAFPPASADEYYWVDLIGLDVLNLQGERLGTVAGLIDTGPHSVIRVTPPEIPSGQSAEEAERLIPFVDAYVQDVSLAERRITVDWGLDY